MGRVLVVYHSQSGNTEAAARAVADGAREIADTEVALRKGLQADESDLRAADAVAIGSPDYFSYMAGGVKDFFDRTYYPTQGEVEGMPCGLFLTHGGGGKAIESLNSLCETFKFESVGEPVLLRNAPDAESTPRLTQLGRALAQAAQ